MIKNIIFDFGGVILKHKATVVADILTEMFPHNSLQAIKIWKDFEPDLKTGRKTSDDLVVKLKNNIGTELSSAQLKQQWIKLYEKEAQGVNWELLEYIEKLKQRFKIYLFTDTIDVHDDYNKTRGIYEKFSRVFKSFEEGVAKVEGKDAFLFILNKIDVKGEECIFIDDVEIYIKYANEIGMRGILFRNFKDLQKQLVLYF